ncbi:similar to Naumovozyma dairenensis hypothetical protein NDAI_0A00850 [Naumovozyma dairenensis CBS 421] [Maudiozyma saulgeensis]|uniref:Helicase C-terminal domain-containing protein n=1 Tax=Maudiozyma saulgeensis TaxID=1789683 RepID=A0A1X7R8L7_9SACH|nr:similar to Naumovozyma dairenensis hypothetical protein NDAI_0A00850 [Naumovozyma dairenensis CBS 421] [Kazachstania saulgeensis]
MQITNMFINDSSKRLLIGTNLVSEVIDIKDLGFVHLFDYVPNPTEYIQIGGRMRAGGIYKCLRSWTPQDDDDGIPMVDPEGDINPQMADFYGLFYSFAEYISLENNLLSDLVNFQDSTIVNFQNDNTLPRSASDDQLPDLDLSELFGVSASVTFEEPVSTLDIFSTGTLEDTTVETTAAANEPVFNTDPKNSDGPPVKKQKISAAVSGPLTKIEAIEAFIKAKGVFPFLGVPYDKVKFLYFHGINHSYFDFFWCPKMVVYDKCLSPYTGKCVCPESRNAASLNRMALECLLVFPLFKSPQEIRNIAKGGVVAGAVLIVQHVSNDKDAYTEMFANYHGPYIEYLDKHCINIPRFPIVKADLIMAKNYNAMWDEIAANQ